MWGAHWRNLANTIEPSMRGGDGGLFMVAIWNRADHYIFALLFILLSSFFFFPRLISAVTDWMSAILPHMLWP